MDDFAANRSGAKNENSTGTVSSRGEHGFSLCFLKRPFAKDMPQAWSKASKKCLSDPDTLVFLEIPWLKRSGMPVGSSKADGGWSSIPRADEVFDDDSSFLVVLKRSRSMNCQGKKKEKEVRSMCGMLRYRTLSIRSAGPRSCIFRCTEREDP